MTASPRAIDIDAPVRAAQDLMIDLIKSVGKKMEDFSHKETVRYYEDIIKRAWQQVVDAKTPEVKSEKYNEHMGWTMLDPDFEDRTQDVFRRGPVYVPIWWNRYDPTYAATRSSGTSARTVAPRSGGSKTSLPSLSKTIWEMEKRCWLWMTGKSSERSLPKC